MVVKLARIISILSLITAGYLFICTAIYLINTKGSENPQTYSIIDKYQQTSNNISDDRNYQVSPLVKEAEKFSLYLNPPPIVAPDLKISLTAGQSLATNERNDRGQKNTPRLIDPTGKENKVILPSDIPPIISSPKFELRGISYHRSKPEKSMALIWKNDSGYRWVRQGDRIDSFTIRQIGSTLILFYDGQIIRELVFMPEQVSTRFARNLIERPASDESFSPKQVTSESESTQITKLNRQEYTSTRKPYFWESNIEKDDNITQLILRTKKQRIESESIPSN